MGQNLCTFKSATYSLPQSLNNSLSCHHQVRLFIDTHQHSPFLLRCKKLILQLLVFRQQLLSLLDFSNDDLLLPPVVFGDVGSKPPLQKNYFVVMKVIQGKGFLVMSLAVVFFVFVYDLLFELGDGLEGTSRVHYN